MSAIVSNPNTQQLEQNRVKLWMVLVGVNHYQDSQIPDLRYCANDCKELAEALKVSTQQFQETEIISLYDGGEKYPELLEIIASLQRFRLAQPEDTVLFYFSGHGYLDSNNQPVLCIKDTILEDLAGTGLKFNILLNELKQCKAKRQLVWLDACQEQQHDNRKTQNPTGQLLAVLERQAEQSNNFHAILSCNHTERSWEIPELKHGLFTYCIIEGLRGKAAHPEGKIDADSLFRYVERNSSKFIEYKKNPISEENIPKGMLGNRKQSSTKLKFKRLPLDASQTPQRIVRGSGELIIGSANYFNQKQALIIDNISFSKVDIDLCKILQSRGNFAVDYCFIRDNHRVNLQKKIAEYLYEKNNKAVILYLTGKIESTNPETHDLVYDRNNRINLNWLGQQLQECPVKNIVLIADILDTSKTNKSLIEILRPDPNNSLCLITTITAVANQRELLYKLVAILETASKSEHEFWVAELANQLQKWQNFKPEVNLNLWFSGSIEVMELLSVEVQRSYNEIFEIDFCPYQGLFAFTEDNAAFFFGREAFTQKLVEAVNQDSLVTVIAPSGSGKSSVVHAGLIPKLKQKGKWQIFSFRPGNNPFYVLASELISHLEPQLQNDSERKEQEITNLAATWRQKDGALRKQLEGIVFKNPDTSLLLVVDQFEELYTLCEEKECQCFLEQLLKVVKALKPLPRHFTFVLTLRADFLGYALSDRSFADVIADADQMLGPMNRKELEEAIAKPAEKLGVRIEEGLTQRILDDVNAQPGQLPLLQFALTQLWVQMKNARLTYATYKEIGGVQGALAQYADRVYQKLDRQDRERVRKIFIQLVEPSNYTRRIATRKEVGEQNWDLIRKLADERLVITNSHQASDASGNLVLEETVEIVHEALIKGWSTLETWVELDKDFRIWQEKLRRSMTEWEPKTKEEDLLLRGLPLVEAEDWLKKRPQEVNSDEQEFIKQSIKARNRRRNSFIFGLTGFSLTVSILAIWAGVSAISEANQKIGAQAALSKSQFALNQRLNALVEGIRASRELKKLQAWGFAQENIQRKVANTLPQLVYGVREQNRFSGHLDKVEGVSFSPNGKLIATVSADKTIKLWHRDGQLVATLKGHRNWVNSVSFSPDGQIIATASSDRTARLWQIECVVIEGKRCVEVKGKLLKTLEGHKDWVFDINFSPDGQTLATASRDGTVKLWNLDGILQQDIPVKSDRLEENQVWGVSFSPDGQIIATANEDKTIKLLSLNGTLIKTLEKHGERVRDVRFSPNGQLILSGSDDNTAIVWQQDGTFVKSLEGHKGHVNHVSFSPDSQTIVTVSDGDDENVKLWSLDGNLLKTFNGHTTRVKGASFSPDGQTIATGSWDRTVRLWSLDGIFPKSLEGHNNRAMDVNFSPDGQTLASASWDRTVKLWKLDGTQLKTIKHSDQVNGVSFSPDGQILATVSSSRARVAQIWSIDGTLLKTLEGHKDYIKELSFSPDGQILATASGDRTVKLWSRDGQLLHTLEGHFQPLYGVSFSPDGEMIASSSKDKTVKLWSRDGQLLHTLEGHSDWIWNVSFSPDGEIIASASEDGTVKLWTRDGTLLTTLEGHTARVSDVTFHPNGQAIATGSADATIKFWSRDGRLLTTLEGHRDRVMSVSFTPDGKTLASASVDGAVKLWNLENQRLSSELDILLESGCDWVRDFLRTNHEIEKSDRALCHEITAQNSSPLD